MQTKKGLRATALLRKTEAEIWHILAILCSFRSLFEGSEQREVAIYAPQKGKKASRSELSSAKIRPQKMGLKSPFFPLATIISILMTIASTPESLFRVCETVPKTRIFAARGSAMPNRASFAACRLTFFSTYTLSGIT